MFTGLLPSQHGAGHGTKLENRFETIAERLAADGYTTVGIAAGTYLNTHFGLTQGFKHYDDRIPGDYPRDLDIISKLAPGELAPAGKRRADQVVRALMFRNGEVLEEPFFLFLHFFDAHSRYTAPLSYSLKFRSWSGGAPYFACDESRHFHRTNVKGLPLNPPLRERITGQYDANIRYIDDHLRLMWAWLYSQGKLVNTTVIVTSDHGESLGEREMLGHHLSLHGEQINVPLMVWTGSGKKGTRLQEPVDSREVFRLASVAAGLKIPRGDGRLAIAEYLPNPKKEEANVERFSSPKKAVIDGCLKILDDEDGTIHGYDICVDSGENQNIFVSGELPVMFHRIESLIGVINDKEAMIRSSKNERELDIPESVEEQLRELGYIQ
jgi:arylsulfatase A-like enzyme